MVKNRGYETRLQSESEVPDFIDDTNHFFRKLISLKKSLEEFGEVLLLDWDCRILKPFDETFYGYLNEKPIQCPIYSHPMDLKNTYLENIPNTSETTEIFFTDMEQTFKIHSWKMNNQLITPNFGFFYSRDKEVGKKLYDISVKNKLRGCVEELAMFIYSDCTLDEYIERYLPKVVRGVSNDILNPSFTVSQIQKNTNNYIDTKIDMDIYLKHL